MSILPETAKLSLAAEVLRSSGELRLGFEILRGTKKLGCPI
jgi:hypothetical protein